MRVPIIGDFHYNGHLLLKNYPECARALAKYRINPGNVEHRPEGRRQLPHHDRGRHRESEAGSHRRELGIARPGAADAHDGREFPARGTERRPRSHHGSDGGERLELGRTRRRIRLAPGPDHSQRESQRRAGSDRRLSRLAARCDYPLHLGLTEAGMGAKGIVASSAALGVVLQEGIGDTIRVSLTPAPGGDRTEEVRVGQQILQSLGIRSFTPQVTACPGCGRTTSTFFQEMARADPVLPARSDAGVEGRYTGVEEMKVAVMGCVVNGPGESKHANLGISLPGTFEEPKAPVYVDGRLFTTLKGDKIVPEFIQILDDYVESHYAAKEELVVRQRIPGARVSPQVHSEPV